MEIIRNVQEQSGELKGEFFWGFYDKWISVSCIEGNHLEEAVQCANYLNNLPGNVIEDALKASIRYRNDFLLSEELPLSLDNPRGVLPLILPLDLWVLEPDRGKYPYVLLEWDCEWEVEHGMIWVIRDDSVVYVGAANAAPDPWEDLADYEEGNYA
ncbi:MAG: hypothetical protein AAF889_12170 [Cyanobacteria bacterium P01_D01_bin.73]